MLDCTFVSTVLKILDTEDRTCWHIDTQEIERETNQSPGKCQNKKRHQSMPVVVVVNVVSLALVESGCVPSRRPCPADSFAHICRNVRQSGGGVPRRRSTQQAERSWTFGRRRGAATRRIFSFQHHDRRRRWTAAWSKPSRFVEREYGPLNLVATVLLLLSRFHFVAKQCVLLLPQARGDGMPEIIKHSQPR